MHLSATVTVSLPRGKKKTISDSFSLWITPTDISKQIFVAGDKNETSKRYREWCLSLIDQYMKVSEAHNHFRELDEWLKEKNEEGWIVEWSII